METTRLIPGNNKKRQLEQDLAHVTQEMYKRNLELAETNRVLSLLRAVDSLALESHDSLGVLADQIARAVITDSNYALVALLAKPGNDNGMWVSGVTVPPTIDSQALLGKLKGARLEIDPTWLASLNRTALVHVGHMSTEEMMTSTGLDNATATIMQEKLPLETVYVVKLQARQRVVGLLVLGFITEMGSLSEADVKLLDRLSEAIGLAMDSKLLFEENQRVLMQLQKTNQKLLALDQAKDDFISMASHQLRTPLTSVKGYVSMVLEGDVGPVNPEQKKLLDQAFLSSQRMVYLIADLLNVSRLKTGKFVIEPKPTNLADLVETELEQLKETAAARDLTITYEKPQNFPVLNLDETKIRQVVMNFADNAIYYTPSGGHIQVAVVDKGDTIEFTVTDDGIGVPKEEQHNLFTKFYRAGNAKKARPDGTGLGLFMAKKVVIAQGGVIIFKTAEGQGSTFGFSFEKERLTPETRSVKVEDEAPAPVAPQA